MQCFWAQCVKLDWRACVCEREKICAPKSIRCLLFPHYIVCMHCWKMTKSSKSSNSWILSAVSRSCLVLAFNKKCIVKKSFIAILWHAWIYSVFRCFHPKWHCIQSIHLINSYIPWDSNPWPGVASNILSCLEEHYNWELLFAKRKKIWVTVLPPYTLSFSGLKSVRLIFFKECLRKKIILMPFLQNAI